MRGIGITLSLLLACGFDSSGQGWGGTDDGTDSDSGGSGGTGGGSGSGTDPSTSGSNGSSGDGGSDSTGGVGSDSGDSTSGGPTTDGTSGDGTTTDGTTDETTGDATTGDATTSDATTSDACAGFTFTEIYPAADGTIEEPMDTFGDPNDSPGIWAQSEVAEEGTITWDVHLDCAATVYLWGVVWDMRAGNQGQGDADSFWLSVDGESPEWRWVYGCTTTEDGWSYQPVTYNDAASGCAEQDLDWDLGAGAHTVRLRNREGSDFQGAAAIARLLVTTDAGLIPNIQDH